jgi:hypothetical protein
MERRLILCLEFVLRILAHVGLPLSHKHFLEDSPFIKRDILFI